MVNPSDDTALRLQRAGVSPALGEQFSEYSQRGLRYAYGLLRNWTDAEEVVQEAFCRMLKSRHVTAEANEFAAVFFRVVRNLCIDEIRRRQRHPTMSLENSIAAGSSR